MEDPEPNGNRSHVAVLHQALVDKLKGDGCIHSARVEAAFRAVPRHVFVPDVALEQVYSDMHLVTKEQDGQPISSSSQPAVMACMLELLDLRPGQCVLEIGAGTGYNAALMAHLVGETGRIVTIDLDEDIVAAAREHLAAAGYKQVHVVCGDGGQGYADAAPYDRVILTVGAADIAPAWREQLAPHGRLLLPLEVKPVTGRQLLVAFDRTDGYLESTAIRYICFIRLRGSLATIPEDQVQLGALSDRDFNIAAERLRIRAYPRDAGYAPSASEAVVDKPSVRLVFGY